MRTTVHLPDDLLNEAKLKAAAEGRTLTSLIEEGLRRVLSPAHRPHMEPEQPRARQLPISRRKGGLFAGADPIKLLQDDEEAADLESLRRASRKS